MLHLLTKVESKRDLSSNASHKNDKIDKQGYVKLGIGESVVGEPGMSAAANSPRLNNAIVLNSTDFLNHLNAAHVLSAGNGMQKSPF